MTIKAETGPNIFRSAVRDRVFIRQEFLRVRKNSCVPLFNPSVPYSHDVRAGEERGGGFKGALIRPLTPHLRA